MRNGALRKRHRLRDVTNAPLLLGEQRQDLHSGRIAKSLKKLRDVLQYFLFGDPIHGCTSFVFSYFIAKTAGTQPFFPGIPVFRLRAFSLCGILEENKGKEVPFMKDIVACTVPAEEVARVKGLGCLRDKTTADCFNIRVLTRNGHICAEEAAALAEAARRFGNGRLAFTTRLTVELQCIPYANIEPLRAFLAEQGLETGGTGPKVRPVVACKGTTCQYGLIDTFTLSEKIHERFYKGYHDVKLPHKFKIAVGGCPNNCVKPDLNDLGIVGQRVLKRDLEACRGCKKCQIETACPIKIAHVEDGKLVSDGCNNCGRCAGKCPFHVCDEYVDGYKVCIGGRWGKRVAQGQPLEMIFTSEEDVLAVVEKAILLFKEQGIAGERFADTISRLGFENVQAQLLSDEILTRKDAIIHA